MILLLLFAVAVAAEPYVLVSSSSTTDFALCLGGEPSEQLRDSLLMCRELSYAFCVNSSLVGAILSSKSAAADHFTHALQTPTIENIEKLAWLVDSALVLLYNAFSEGSTATIECAHEWRSWVCSRAFHRVALPAAAAAAATPHPYDVCAAACERAALACTAEFACATYDAHSGECTDFYVDSGQTCVAVNGATAAGDAGAPVPVFRAPALDSGGWMHSAAARRSSSAACWAVLVALALAYR